MANKDGIVSIGFDYKKELDEVCATIEKELNSLGGDINLSDGIKKQMTEIKKMITDMKKDIGSSFDKITETKLDTKTFESFKKDVNKRIREINKEVTALKEQFSTLDGSANVNGIVQQFANLKKHVEDSNASISELISNSEKLGKSVNLKNVSSNLKGNIDDIKKQIDSLERSLNVLDGNGMTSYKNKSVEKLKEDIIELVTNFDNVQNKCEVLSETLKNTDKSSPLFNSLEKQAIEYELKLAEILTRIETIRNEIDNKGLEKYEKQLEDYNNHKIVKTKSDGSVEYAKEPNYPAPIDLSDIIPLDIDEKIDELIDNGFESGVSKAKALLSELRTELNSITNRPEKTELNGASNNIEVHISTKQSTINKQLDEMIDNLQQRAANKPIIAPVKLRVDSEYEKTTKDTFASALTENQINEARKDVENVVPGLEKAFNNSMRIATNKAVENAKESIKAVREFFETNPITVHLTVPEDERLKIGKSILSEDGKTTVDISGQVDKARESVKGLSKDLEKSQLLIKENAQNAKNLSLEKLVNSLSETMTQFSELKGIISSIQNMESTIARARGISSTNELIEQWNVVEKTIINATKLDGDFRKNANIGKIVSEYQKYIDMGGTNTLSSIDKIKDSETTINSILSKMKELKSQDIENGSIQKLSVDLGDVIAKFNELISTVKTATNALYKIIKQGSISDLDKQWSSISNKFKSIADESDKINLSKQKTDIKELMDMYQKYENAGGTNSLMSLTDNVETLRKLDKEYQKLNQTQSVDNSSTIEKESESFKSVEKSVDSLTTAIGDTKVQAINVEATAMEDAAEREIMAIRSILDNLGLVVDRLKDIKGIKLPKIEIKNVDVVEKAVESLENTENKSNISSANSSTAEAEKYQQITNDTVSVLTDVGKTEDQIIAKIQKERQEAEANNDVLREHLVLLDSAGKVIANHWGSKSNVNGTFTSEQLAQANGGKIIHAHPGKASFFGGKDLQNLIQNSMYDQIKQIELIWGDSTLSVDKSTLTKESGSALLNIMRNVRSKLTEIYSDNQGGTPSREAREHINAIEKEIFKAVSQKLDISVSEKGTMSQEVVDSLSDIDKAIIKKFRDIESSVVRDINPSDIISSVLPMKDVFQGDEASKINDVAEATNNLADAENRLNIVEDKKSAQKYWQGRFKDSISDMTKTNDELVKMNKYYSDLEKMSEKLVSAQNKVDNANIDINKLSKRDVQSGDYIKAIENYKNAITELQNYINRLNNNGIQSQDDIDELNRLQKTIDEVSKSIKNMSASEKGTNIAKSSTVFLKIEELRDKYKGMSKDMQKELDRLERKFAGLGDTIDTGRAIGELKQFETQLIKTGTATNSLWSAMKDKAFYNFANQLGTMVSFYDLVNVGREGFQTIREYDNALTEMNKVSKESIETLKDFQKESFGLSDAIGTTASQIQNSTADFLRLGESFEQAKQSAQDANALFKVAEFDNIDEATEALVAMSQAYKELDKSQINDVLNYTGNNFSISTSELASALQRSAATLKVAGNDIYEATALVTAGNAVLQDAETVGSGLKMISLRILGTEEAKNELASLGEDVDDFVVQTQSKIDETVRSYTAVASNAFKGISVLDENGNYRSTYEILRDISLVYQEILEADKKAGTNRGQALLEVLAGKNRSNVAASILQSPELLTSVYEEAINNSQGSVAKELESQLQSIETHLNQLKNSWDKLWVNENNREVINFFLDLTKGILEVVDDIGVLNTAFIGIGAGLGIKNIGREKCYPSYRICL